MLTQYTCNYKGKNGLEVVRKMSTWRGGGSISLLAYLEADWTVKERITGNISALQIAQDCSLQV